MTDEIVDTQPPATDGTPPPQTPAWFIDEGVPGVGARPPWLSDKFKTAAEMAKSYSELEKKFGSAPEDYDFSKSKMIDPDYVPFQELKALAKDKRVPQEVMDKMLESFDKYMGEFSVDFTEESKKLGENAKERLALLDNWAKANLKKDSYEALTSSLTSAEAIMALEELRGKMMTTTTIPNGNDNGGNAEPVTIDSLKAEMITHFDKYQKDPKYRADWQSRMAIAAKNSGIVDKIGG